MERRRKALLLAVTCLLWQRFGVFADGVSKGTPMTSAGGPFMTSSSEAAEMSVLEIMPKSSHAMLAAMLQLLDATNVKSVRSIVQCQDEADMLSRVLMAHEITNNLYRPSPQQQNASAASSVDPQLPVKHNIPSYDNHNASTYVQQENNKRKMELETANELFVGTWGEPLLKEKFSYYERVFYVVWGDAEFLEEVIQQATALYIKAHLGVLKVQWIWILQSDSERSCKSHYRKENVDWGSESTVNTGEASFEKLTRRMFYGTRGLILTTALKDNKRIRRNDVIVWRLVWYPVEGLKVQFAARSRGESTSVQEKHKNLFVVYEELWPKPQRNFNKAPVIIVPINKRTVFMMGQEPNVKDLAYSVGYCADVLRIAEVYMNFTPVFNPTRGFGTVKNKSWTGMVGVLHLRQAEIAPLDFTPTAARMEVIDFSEVLNVETLVMISRAATVKPTPFLLLQIYTPLIMGLLLLMSLTVGIVVTLLTWKYSTFAPSASTVEKVDPTKPNLYYLSIGLKFTLFQSSKWLPPQASGRVMCVIALVVAVIITSTYSGSITAFLALPQRSSTINSAAELASSNMVPYVRGGAYLRAFFAQNFAPGPLYDISQRIMHKFSAEMNGDFWGKVADGSYAAIDTFSSAMALMLPHEHRLQRCRFHVSKDSLKGEPDNMAYSRNARTTYHMDDMIRWLRSYGIIEYLRKQHYAVPCQVEFQNTGPHPLALKQCLGVVYLYWGAVFVSAVAFAAELIWWRVQP